ncbi:helix-turn-helix domain-containing protein [Pseudodesulfovibrio sp. JC047]|uniref:helix-turn-helix domain-containing protein n=1 Tax=Pseudodesulfovibrio sp. JC047 TaxID=2683199 RepID=UPI0013D6F1AA|nr:helix-turn-helix domain-containing protein [Pseudodesulfovibrio sp. JC047]
MPNETVGDRIRTIRGGVSQKEFAEKYGLNRNTLARYEKGDNDPSASFLKALIEDYGLDANWLLLGGEEPPRQELTPREAALLDNYRHSPEDAQRNLETTSALLAQHKKKNLKDTG